jgi:hypothetical protein
MRPNNEMRSNLWIIRILFMKKKGCGYSHFGIAEIQSKFARAENGVELKVLYGSLDTATLRLSFIRNRHIGSIAYDVNKEANSSLTIKLRS